MGTFTVSLTSTPFTGSKSYTISDADVSTLIAYLQNQYADPVTGPVTQGQALVAWVNAWVNSTRFTIQTAQTVHTVPPSITFT